MSTFIIHLLIPPLTIMAVRYIPIRYVWAWVWVSVLPDVDYAGWILYVNHTLSVNLHRALFHNVWITLTLAALATRSYRRFRSTHPALGLAQFAQTWSGAGWILSTYYHFSHVLLDVSQGGVVPFWPLSNLNLYSFFELDVDTRTQQVTPIVGTEVTPGAPDVDPIYPWINSEETVYVLLILASLLLAYWIRRREARPRVKAVLVAPPPAVNEP